MSADAFQTVFGSGRGTKDPLKLFGTLAPSPGSYEILDQCIAELDEGKHTRSLKMLQKYCKVKNSPTVNALRAHAAKVIAEDVLLEHYDSFARFLIFVGARDQYVQCMARSDIDEHNVIHLLQDGEAVCGHDFPVRDKVMDIPSGTWLTLKTVAYHQTITYQRCTICENQAHTLPQTEEDPRLGHLFSEKAQADFFALAQSNIADVLASPSTYARDAVSVSKKSFGPVRKALYVQASRVLEDENELALKRLFGDEPYNASLDEGQWYRCIISVKSTLIDKNWDASAPDVSGDGTTRDIHSRYRSLVRSILHRNSRTSAQK